MAQVVNSNSNNTPTTNKNSFSTKPRNSKNHQNIRVSIRDPEFNEYVLKKQKEQHITKPDVNQHKKEIAKVHQEIEQVQTRLNNAREIISQAAGKKGSIPNRSRSELTARLQEIKKQQAEIKIERKPLFDEINKLNEQLKELVEKQKKMSANCPFKNIQDLDSKIKSLESMIESGKIRVVEEKKILTEISGLNKVKRSYGSLQKLNDQIKANKARIEEIKQILNDNKTKELSEEFNEIQNKLNYVIELDNKEKSKLSGLLEKKNVIQKELDALYSKRRELYDTFNHDIEQYNNWLQKIEEEKQQQDKVDALELEKQNFQDKINEETEKSNIPAFEDKIKECDFLIAYLSEMIGNSNLNISKNTNSNTEPNNVINSTQREIEKNNLYSDNDLFLLGSNSSKNSKKRNKSTKEFGKTKLKIPINIIQHFWNLEIKPPASKQEIEQIIENIKSKKQWFIDNQEAATIENKQDAEKRVAEMKKQFEEKFSISCS